jgi:hypothetical protein
MKYMFLGSCTELKYTLQTFGIPSFAIPLTDEGEVLLESERDRWAKQRRKEEERRSYIVVDRPTEPSTTVRVGTPGNSDVLLGRGRLFQNHVGNIRFRYLVLQYQERYDEASKQEKTKFAVEIVAMTKKRKGRFLRDDGAGWLEVDDCAAREKVSSCFRSFRKVGKGNEEQANKETRKSSKREHCI